MNVVWHNTYMYQHQIELTPKVPHTRYITKPLISGCISGIIVHTCNTIKYSLFYRALLQKRLIILRSLLIVATPYVYQHQIFLTQNIPKYIWHKLYRTPHQIQDSSRKYRAICKYAGLHNMWSYMCVWHRYMSSFGWTCPHDHMSYIWSESCQSPMTLYMLTESRLTHDMTCPAEWWHIFLSYAGARICSLRIFQAPCCWRYYYTNTYIDTHTHTHT